MVPALFSLALVLISNPARADPFTVDTSTVYVNGGRVGIRTLLPQSAFDVNGDAQFGAGSSKSSFTATGLLMLTANGIQWSDGSTSTTAVGVSISTMMVGMGFSINNTTLGICQATVTVTTHGCVSSGQAVINLTYTDDGNNRTACATMLMNGAFMSPYDASTPMRCWNGFTFSANIPQFLSGVFPIPAATVPCSGTVNFCLSLTNSTNGANLTFPARPGIGPPLSDANSWGAFLFP